MKKTLALFFISLCVPFILLAKAPVKAQLLSSEETLKVLDSMKHNAIVFGNGENEIHTFIDPYCELSQRYISFIFKKKDRMFTKYKFYFYLYELQGKNSSHIISTILSSEYKQTILKSIMVDHSPVEINEDDDAYEVIDEIKEAARTIGVFKRPYIIINGKVK